MVLLVMFIPFRWIGLFQPLPRGSTNSRWSQRAIEENHSRLFDSLTHMAETASLMVRVEVLSERILTLGFGDTVRIYDQFSVYRLLVKEVFSGDVEKGSIIEMLQFRRLQGRTLIGRMFWSSRHGYDSLAHSVYGFSLDFIRLPIRQGDDLILFLEPRYITNSLYAILSPSMSRDFITYPFFSPTPSLASIQPPIEQVTILDAFYVLINPIQAVYRYAPPEVRAKHDNWVFENFNRHNNLVLTEADLLRIRGE